MKTIFIEAKYREKINLDKNVIKRLPKKIGLVGTVQFMENFNEVKRLLTKNNKKIIISKNEKLKYGGQILGCDVSAAEKIKKDVDAFLFIGDGKFHPLEIKMKTGKRVFTYNPFTKQMEKIDEREIEKFRIRKKVNYMKFLHGENIGVLISTKRGQRFSMDKLDKIKKKFSNKNFYAFIFDTLNVNELENFPFIECFVNTACPRLIEDIEKPAVNVGEII